jgi:uncharacterized membrane protein
MIALSAGYAESHWSEAGIIRISKSGFLDKYAYAQNIDVSVSDAHQEHRMVKRDESRTVVSVTAALELPLQIAIPLAKIVPWAIFGVVMAGLAYYFVGAEQGATSIFNGMSVHEFVHDARHLLGFPCH